MLTYFLWANIYAALFFMLYCFLIRGKPNHAWSRFFLLGALLLSMVLPAIRLDVLSSPFVKDMQAVGLPEVILNGSRKASLQSGSGAAWWQMIYSIAAAMMVLLFLYRIITLKIFLDRQKFILQDGFKLSMNTGYGPASFGNIIVFPGKEIDPSILKHEMAHLELKHHYDKILLQLIRCFFFPVIALHFMYKEIILIHEFEADERAGADKEAYSKTLLSAQMSSSQLYLMQNFFHHPLKRRIKMLYKNKTPDTGRKVLLLTFSVITLAAVLILQSNPLAAQERKDTTEDNVYKSVEHVPEFPGGLAALQAFLTANLRYPEAARKNNIQGKVIIQFVIDKEGDVTDVQIKRDLPMGCGDEARRVVSAMPKWKPGVHEGEKVKVYYTLPVTFRLSK